MTDIYLVVLAVEIDASDPHPGLWNWAELTDSPHPVDVVAAVKSVDNMSVTGNLQRLASMIVD